MTVIFNMATPGSLITKAFEDDFFGAIKSVYDSLPGEGGLIRTAVSHVLNTYAKIRETPISENGNDLGAAYKDLEYILGTLNNLNGVSDALIRAHTLNLLGLVVGSIETEGYKAERLISR
ncbi:MAG: hypothetical protein AABW87_03760 [Nanoarchaeota archaeon]